MQAACRTMPETITANDLAGLLRPGMTVFVQGSTGQPTALLRALDISSSRLGGVRFISPVSPGINRFDLNPGINPDSLVTFMDYRELRQSWNAGPIEFMPMHWSAIVPYLRNLSLIDMALIQVAPPDAHGQCSTGLSADFVPDILSHCEQVVAQINPAMPTIEDAPAIPLEKIAYILQAAAPLPVVAEPQSDATSESIAKHAAGLVRDGDTIQFGVGKLPTLVVSALGEKADLGLHTGLASPVIRPLIESGVMTGKRKTRDAGKHVTGAIWGNPEFYEWVARRPDIAMRPVSCTHAQDVLSEIDNFVAINAALEVDLLGQVNAEFAGGRQVSSCGGLVDFVRGARRSRGGRAIICLRAARDGGRQSNIVSVLKTPVTVCRTDIDIVVTEHGAASLADKSLAQRVDALIAIAAPQHRDRLRSEWSQAFS